MIGVAINATILIIKLLSIFSKKIITNLVIIISRILEEFRYKKVEEFRQKCFKQIEEYKNGAKLLMKNKKVLVKILITTIIQVILYHSILMSLGFFLILAIRDSFQVYIEDTALKITKEDEQQKIMIDIEVYRKLGQLLLSGAFTLILMKYELIVIEFLLLIVSIIEIIVNKKMCRSLEEVKNEL